jgi:hypothetical protein
MAADTQTARVFMAGRRQAVWLPEGLRLEGTQVAVHREGETLVLTPLAADDSPVAGPGGSNVVPFDPAPRVTEPGPEDPGPEQRDLFP